MVCISILYGTWEKKKQFIERWELGVRGMAQSPERTQALLDALYIKGISGDTKSAELYLRATNQMPNATQNVNIKTESSVKDLTDEELQSMILEISQQRTKFKESQCEQFGVPQAITPFKAIAMCLLPA